MHRSFDQAPNQAGACRNSQHRPMSPRCRLLELFSMPLHRHHDTLEKPDISSGSPQLANGQTAQTKEMASVRCHSPLSTSNSGPRSTVLSHFSRSHASGKEPQPSRRALNTDSSPYMAPEIQSPRPLHAKSPMAHPGAISVVSILSPGPRPVERENGASQVTFANDKAPVEPGANDQFVSDPSPSFLRNKKSRTQLHVMTFAPPSHEPSSLVPPLGIKTSTLSPRPDNTRRSFLADTSLESARSKSVASLTSSGSLRSVRPSRSDKRRNFTLGSFHFEGADKKAERTNTSETDVSSPTSSQEHKSSGSKSPVSSSPIEDPIEAGWTLVYLPSSGSLARKSSKASMDPKTSPRLNGDLTLGRSTSMSSHSRSASLRTASHPHFSFETARDVAMSRRT
ncbi:hypothetical protein SISNIDRAFT_199164 [Sistotremastrum niveocremeum HHB9708]|uniref:Uncharacterized protein n=1 Tax=Sistotremastrum niveocremeum HHB9708 TaxID=1314777 RepID=A0A164ZMY6_9AGAM|nr:hypothetical protein SISNIDRAFT_199164 [Sistotremastrum niveocremeum HHB9708]